MQQTVSKIVSGGQTGVDRAALNVARELGIAHGGWCPKGRRAEDGVIPREYHLLETTSVDYSERTERNVVDSDGTLVLFVGQVSGGTALTVNMAARHGRPLMTVDLHSGSLAECAGQVRQWLGLHHIQVLNVAGPRASNAPGVGRMAEWFLDQVLSPMTTPEPDD